MDPQTKPGAPAAVDVEAGVRPRKQPLRPIRAEKLPADEKARRLTGEDLGEPRVVDPRDLLEDARLVHSALGHQKMEVHVEINPVPEGLDGGHDPRRKRAPGHNFEVSGQGPEGAAAEIPQEPALSIGLMAYSYSGFSGKNFIAVFGFLSKGENGEISDQGLRRVSGV